MVKYVLNGLLATSLFCGLSFAQVQSPATSVDLSAPALLAHGTLPQNNIPTLSSDLMDGLNRAQSFAKTKGIVSDTLIIEGNDEGVVGTSAQMTTMYKKMACDVAAIVIGHTNLSISHLTPSRSNIYTDYDFTVDQVVKNDAAAPMVPSSHIVVTRLGGAVQLTANDGALKTLDVRLGLFPDLQANVSYMAFLGYVPASGGYQPAGASATLLNNNGQWMVARKAFATVVLNDLKVGVLENSIPGWLSSCVN